MADKWPIHAAFTGYSWRKIKEDIDRDPVKAQIVAYIPDIIATGEYRVEKPSHNHPEYNVFHTYRKKIQTEYGEKEAIVDVAERVSGLPVNVGYNLTREGTRGYNRRRSANAAHSGELSQPKPITPSQDSDTVNKENVSPQYEVVNIRFIDDAFQGKPTAHDSAIKSQHKFGGLMGKFKRWFGGANDANPEVEKEEVDLAQAIIDLHKRDPNTGEIVDIAEDEDKAEEIRKIIGEISGKLEPEEIEKLNQALAAGNAGNAAKAQGGGLRGFQGCDAPFKGGIIKAHAASGDITEFNLLE